MMVVVQEEMEAQEEEVLGHYTLSVQVDIM
jgi:hypothetical protein